MELCALQNDVLVICFQTTFLSFTKSTEPERLTNARSSRNMARHGKGRMTPKKLATFVLLMFMIICAIIMIYYGLIVVKPYTFTADFIWSQCSPVALSFKGRLDCICTMASDSAAGTCVSEYPCAQITVRYRSKGSQTDQNAKLLKSFSANHRNTQVCKHWI